MCFGQQAGLNCVPVALADKKDFRLTLVDLQNAYQNSEPKPTLQIPHRFPDLPVAGRAGGGDGRRGPAPHRAGVVLSLRLAQALLHHPVLTADRGELWDRPMGLYKLRLTSSSPPSPPCSRHDILVRSGVKLLTDGTLSARCPTLSVPRAWGRE